MSDLKNINFKLKSLADFSISKRAATTYELLQILRPSVYRGTKAPSVPSSVNFDPELGFEIISSLESGKKSWIKGDSGNSFGLTQVHGPYFMAWLARNPNLKNITGLDPSKLEELSKTWKENLKSIRRQDIWKTVPVDRNTVIEFIKNNPKKVVRRKEGTTIRMNPGSFPGVVKKVGNNFVGKEINIDLLKEKYGFNLTNNSIARLQRTVDTYITDLVLKSALAQILTSQEHPSTSARFYNTFSSRNVKKNEKVKRLSDWVSRTDFMSKMKFLINDVMKYGYNTNAPGAYNMYQLMAITNGSGPYRVRRFLKNKQKFGPGHTHYLTRANPAIRKMTGLSTDVVDGGEPGFSKPRLSSLKIAEMKQDNQTIFKFIKDWINNEIGYGILKPYGIKFIDKDENSLYLTMLKEDINNFKTFLPEKIEGLDVVYKTYIEKDDQEFVNEFEKDDPTVVDPLKNTRTERFSEIVKEYEWFLDHLDEVKDDLEERYDREFTEEEIKQVIVNTLEQKYQNITSNFNILIQKCASYLEPATLYFPGQYAEDIKSGKRRISIRPADVNVKPDEQVKCKSYSGGDIADVRIIDKKIMSITRIEKAYGVNAAKSLRKRFGPDKRFVIIEFEPIDINFADDKMDEVLIDGNKKLLNGRSPYENPEDGAWIDFPEEELESLKIRLDSSKPIFTTRILEEKDKYSKGDILGSVLGDLEVIAINTGFLDEHPFINELTDEQKEEIGEHEFDLIKLKPAKVFVDKSQRGVFTRRDFFKGEQIATILCLKNDGWKKTRIGKYTDKSETPNTKMVRNDDNVVLIAKNYINRGEEITLNPEPPDLNTDLDEIEFADDKMDEVLIDGNKKLTREQIKNHYLNPEIRKKIMSRIKDKPVLIYLGADNKKILKRNHNDKPIIINDDNPKNNDKPNNYFYWVDRRVLSFHQVFGTETKLGFVDLDIYGDFKIDKAKKYAKDLIKELKAKYNSTPTIYESGGAGLHIEFKLKQEVSIDKLRDELKDLLDKLNKNWEDVTTGIVKGSGMRTDVSTLHNKGSIRVPGSLGEDTGDVKKSLDGEQDTAENNYRNAPLYETKYDYTDPEEPFYDALLKTEPPEDIYDYNSASFISKRQKKASNIEKEYIWLWDPINNKFLYNLNEEGNIKSHNDLAEEAGIELNLKTDKFRGLLYFFSGEDKGEVVLYKGNPKDMPNELIKSLNHLAAGEFSEKEINVPKGVAKELWKEDEKERQYKRHMEKRHWMGLNEPDPNFVEELDKKFAFKKNKILMLVAPKDFYEMEYFIPRRVFTERYDFKVSVVSRDTRAFGEQGTGIISSKISDVEVKDYSALFVVGGKGMVEFSKDKNAQELLKGFVDQKKPVAMICHGPLLGAAAKVIENIEITGWPDIVGKIKRAKGIWTGMPVEKCGLFFSAVGPDEAEDLAEILSSFLMGKKTLIPAENRLLNWKKSQEKIEKIWKIAEDLDEDELEKLIREQQEEEETDEIETEQDRLEKAIPNEVEEVKPIINKEEEEEEEEESEEKLEEVLKKKKEKNIGFKQIVKPEEEVEEIKEEVEEPDYGSLFDADIDENWKEDINEDMEEDEEETGDKTPIFGLKLEPPKNKKGEIIDRWYDAEEIKRPPMPPEARDLFTLENMKDGPSLTKLFQNPDAWRFLKENPSLAQTWILPAIIMGIGKRWFDNNSTKLKFGSKDKDIGRTPFGMFDVGDISQLQQGTPIYDLPSSKAYISLVNEITTNLANTYFSFGHRINERGSLPIGGYIYKSLSREMSKIIAQDKGFKEIRVPVCSFCRSRKQKRQSKEVVYNVMEVVEGSKPKKWVCPECKRKFEENRKTLIELNNIVNTKQRDVNITQNRLNRVMEGLINNPTEELYEKRKEYEEQIVKLATEIKQSKSNLEDIKKVQYSLEVHINGVPYWHTWCPNERCPGNRVPLTALDRENDFWKTEAGLKAGEVLAQRFGISVPTNSQEADEGDAPNISPHRVPPEELLDVPFICPHDYVKFTLRSATGKGLNRKGGYFWEPWQHMLWDKIGKEEIGTIEDDLGEVNSDQEENIRNQLIQRTSLYLSGLGTKLFNAQYSNAIKEYNDWFVKNIEKLREKGKPIKEAMNIVETSKPNSSKQRILSMYKTLGETSELDPGMFISWLSEIGINSQFVADKEGNIREVNKTEKITLKDRKDNIYIPILHSWVSNIMETRNDWFEYYKMEDILANQEADGIYSNGPGTFFIAKIGDVIEEDDINFGFNCNLEVKTRDIKGPGPTSYRQPEEWTLPSKSKVPYRSHSSKKPKVLKFIGLWKIPEGYMKFVKNEQWLKGKSPIPINNKLIEYARSNPEENLAGEITHGDFSRVSLDVTDSSFNMGEYVLVQALIMPGKYNPEPIVAIRNIRNQSDTHKQIFSKVGALMNERYIDPESKALLQEFFEDIQNYGDDPEEMELYMEDLIKGFEELKKKASFSLSKRAKDPLSNYKKKRDFNETPEPEGKVEEKNKHRFVIQDHDAEKADRHFDLRLENDEGTLSSFVIPKHKLPKEKEKLLVIKTEDHPLSYRTFKGKIPSGYGKGDVEIHDSGTYEKIEWKPNKIIFKLKGKKEKGTYNLIKTDENWLIMKSSFLSKRAGQEYVHNDKEFSVDMLIALTEDNKVEEVPVSTLEWNLEEKVWGKTTGKTTPKEVLDNPKKYKKEFDRIKDVDLKHPILLYNGEVVDGYHRLSKAFMNNKKTIKVIVLNKKQMETARIDKEKRKELTTNK